MDKRWRGTFWGAALLCALAAGRGGAELTGDEATITSDHMELIDHGQKTIFEGNVTLLKPGYSLRANRMMRTRDDGLIEAEGRIQARWKSPEGNQVDVRGDKARYDPNTEIAELWTTKSKKVTVDWKDKNGSAHFKSDRAEYHSGERRVRLYQRVTGHVIPNPQ